MKSCSRAAASAMHETRKLVLSLLSKVITIEDLVVENLISKDIFSSINITQTDSALRYVSRLDTWFFQEASGFRKSFRWDFRKVGNSPPVVEDLGPIGQSQKEG